MARHSKLVIVDVYKTGNSQNRQVVVSVVRLQEIERVRKAVARQARRLRLEMESRCGQAKGGGGDVVPLPSNTN